MTLVELIIIVVSITVGLFSIYCIAKAKKQKNKSYLYILAIVFPLIGPMVCVFMLASDSKLFWQNRATKDDMWLAKEDIGTPTNGDGE